MTGGGDYKELYMTSLENTIDSLKRTHTLDSQLVSGGRRVDNLIQSQSQQTQQEAALQAEILRKDQLIDSLVAKIRTFDPEFALDFQVGLLGDSEESNPFHRVEVPEGSRGGVLQNSGFLQSDSSPVKNLLRIPLVRKYRLDMNFDDHTIDHIDSKIDVDVAMESKSSSKAISTRESNSNDTSTQSTSSRPDSLQSGSTFDGSSSDSQANFQLQVQRRDSFAKARSASPARNVKESPNAISRSVSPFEKDKNRPLPNFKKHDGSHDRKDSHHSDSHEKKKDSRQKDSGDKKGKNTRTSSTSKSLDFESLVEIPKFKKDTDFRLEEWTGDYEIDCLGPLVYWNTFMTKTRGKFVSLCKPAQKKALEGAFVEYLTAKFGPEGAAKCVIAKTYEDPADVIPALPERLSTEFQTYLDMRLDEGLLNVVDTKKKRSSSRKSLAKADVATKTRSRMSIPDSDNEDFVPNKVEEDVETPQKQQKRASDSRPIPEEEEEEEVESGVVSRSPLQQKAEIVYKRRKQHTFSSDQNAIDPITLPKTKKPKLKQSLFGLLVKVYPNYHKLSDEDRSRMKKEVRDWLDLKLGDDSVDRVVKNAAGRVTYLVADTEKEEFCDWVRSTLRDTFHVHFDD